MGAGLHLRVSPPLWSSTRDKVRRLRPRSPRVHAPPPCSPPIFPRVPQAWGVSWVGGRFERGGEGRKGARFPPRARWLFGSCRRHPNYWSRQGGEPSTGIQEGREEEMEWGRRLKRGWQVPHGDPLPRVLRPGPKIVFPH